jgi:hypothetical protein
MIDPRETPPPPQPVLLDENATIYELTRDHPELIDTLKALGFAGVANPVLRATVGRTMTLRTGCERMGKDYAQVLRELAARGWCFTATDT